MRWGGRENNVITPFVEYLTHNSMGSLLIYIKQSELCKEFKSVKACLLMIDNEGAIDLSTACRVEIPFM